LEGDEFNAATSGRAQDEIGIGRWLNEGGQLASEAMIEREMTAEDHRGDRAERKRVLIAGGGVAGLETLLALRALAPDRVQITILAPELKFINRSMSAAQPFNPQRARDCDWRTLRPSSAPAGIAGLWTASSTSGAALSPGTGMSFPMTCWCSCSARTPSGNGAQEEC